ncbi:MAG: hydrogenase small subunit [Eggerthellaceae bacterium]|nr:hydrogenase small subunit [Eggerthellaceae bacterium]
MSESTATYGLVDVLAARGISRRSFLKFCGTLAVAAGLSSAAAPRVANALETELENAKGGLFPVLWIEGASCTGCTESFAQIETPDVGKVVLELIALNYSDVLCAGAGHSLERAKEETIQNGNYVVVYEGGITQGFGSNTLRVAMETGEEILVHAAENAAAVIALGSCAVNGGWMAAYPNPAEATGVSAILKKHGIATPVVNMPGCPANPEWLMSVLVQVLMLGGAGALVEGNIPAVVSTLGLNDEAKPQGIYGQTIHDNCERRPHFENGEFVYEFGSKEEELGYCLYPLGCKGPQTKANCGVTMWNNRRSWCIQAGSPCIGCCEANPNDPGDNWVEVNTPFYKRDRDLHIGSTFFRPTTVAAGLTGIVAAALIIHGFGMKKSGRMDGGADFEKVRAWDAKNPDKAIGQYEYSVMDGDPVKMKAAQEEIAKQYEVAEEASAEEEGR